MHALLQENTVISEHEYLAHYSQLPDVKYEYINGEIWAMGNASKSHNVIAGNFYVPFRLHLKGTSCMVYMETQKIKVGQNYYLPDVIVDCGKQDDKYTATQPIVIIEVLSESTRETDLTIKLRDYQKIPSLQEYVLVEQDFMAVTVYRRVDDWKAQTYSQSDDLIELKSIDFAIMVAEIYADVVFPEKKHFQAA
ncbi:Uma2 family endonuclease [Alysiella filiformis]|uniref:Endonuclease, Uma2 family (Restriction endonuclease fold) n=1 Tax=Alysiella filiformis DSM 16848 TaxID=1120981 RepID=A0A286EFN7_9NEIS|nr:Uma2 family endonuclease [Alysiella filiformis]QMT30506.1 Uma2 family endonuclease [Alysiella filiformis]UBQ56514.1 Uma2 family endonuclease [Alysiella filiformis DSM 16848]SOD69721.1 Endonuclease, Uma2 family (restriction endonuclease fold) [Alysiella filiformis DSM 16848]